MSSFRWIALVALVQAAGLFCPDAQAAPTVGQPAPPLVAPELDGHVFDLSALRGKVLIVNFWATWCEPCLSEMPVLNGFYRQYHGRGLEMIGISADRPRDRDRVMKVMQSLAYPAAMMRDAKDNGFGVPESLPVTYIVGADGVIRAKITPTERGITQQELDNAVLPLLPRAERAGG